MVSEFAPHSAAVGGRVDSGRDDERINICLFCSEEHGGADGWRYNSINCVSHQSSFFLFFCGAASAFSSYVLVQIFGKNNQKHGRNTF